MKTRVYRIQSIVIVVLTLFLAFAYFSNTYAWYSIKFDSKNQGASIKVVNDFQMDVQWYDEVGKKIPKNTVDFIEKYDETCTRFISMENKGVASFYGMLSFDTYDLSYDFYLNRFSYSIYEIYTLDNLRMDRILKGSGAPASGLGVISNYYVNTVNNDLYKKTSSGWGSPITKTYTTSKPSGTGSAGVIYLYKSSSYYVMYQYINNEWEVIAYDI